MLNSQFPILIGWEFRIDWSVLWVQDWSGLTPEREREQAVGIKDQSGLTIFLLKTNEGLAGQKITLTIQVDNVESEVS